LLSGKVIEKDLETWENPFVFREMKIGELGGICLKNSEVYVRLVFDLSFHCGKMICSFNGALVFAQCLLKF